jgi:hypothetical protein
VEQVSEAAEKRINKSVSVVSNTSGWNRKWRLEKLATDRLSTVDSGAADNASSRKESPNE